MGKNYSQNNVTGKRKKSDAYFTPHCLTEEFLNADDGAWKDHCILEPACGQGDITQVLRDRGFSDVVEYDILTGTDFLEEIRTFPYIITNPPFSLALKFIKRAKMVAREQFAFLLPLTYLQGSARLREIWSDRTYPLSRVYVFNRYPMLGLPLREDGKVETGMTTLAWFVWEKRYTGEPVIRWIDIDRWIVKKADR